MRTVRALGKVALDPSRALALWVAPDRWPGFVEGFARVVELDPRWPAVGATVVWESIPEGRGRVSERVVEHDAEGRFATEVSERPLAGGPPRLEGRQSATFSSLAVDSPPSRADSEAADGASGVELRLAYELGPGSGAFGGLTDLLFVRRSLREALERTLARFGAEAAAAGGR